MIRKRLGERRRRGRSSLITHIREDAAAGATRTRFSIQVNNLLCNYLDCGAHKRVFEFVGVSNYSF